MTNDGTYTYTYDDEGNLTKKSKGASDETWTYTIDHNNRLTGIEKRATDGGTLQLKVTYTYDAVGNRVQEEKWMTGVGTSTERYAYDGAHVWADLDGSNALQMRRFFGDGIDNLMARISSGGTLAFYLNDRQGSVSRVVNSSGTLVGTMAYDAWGKVTSSSGSIDRYGHNGRERDDGTGFQYNRMRYYDVATGRWVNPDPIGFRAGDPNLYRYVGNSPTNYTDPAGLFNWTNAATGAVGGMAGGIVVGAVIGTAFVPGAGTVLGGDIGVVVGGIGGFIYGGFFTDANTTPGEAAAGGFVVGGMLTAAAMMALDVAAAVMAGGAGGEALNQLDHLYRGDSRPPEDIFRNGFQPMGTNMDLQNHHIGGPNSGYVAASTDFQSAMNMNDINKGGYVYTFTNPGTGIDINKYLIEMIGRGYGAYANEAEIAIPHGIDPTTIINTSVIGPGDKVIDIITNPNFRPPP